MHEEREVQRVSNLQNDAWNEIRSRSLLTSMIRDLTLRSDLCVEHVADKFVKNIRAVGTLDHGHYLTD